MPTPRQYRDIRVLRRRQDWDVKVSGPRQDQDIGLTVSRQDRDVKKHLEAISRPRCSRPRLQPWISL